MVGRRRVIHTGQVAGETDQLGSRRGESVGDLNADEGRKSWGSSTRSQANSNLPIRHKSQTLSSRGFAVAVFVPARDAHAGRTAPGRRAADPPPGRHARLQHGARPESFRVTTDFAMNGKEPRQNLAGLFQPLPDHRWELPLKQPIARAEGTLTASVKDKQGTKCGSTGSCARRSEANGLTRNPRKHRLPEAG
jgi:hypothetical protein